MKYIAILLALLFCSSVNAGDFFGGRDYSEAGKVLQNQKPFDSNELDKLIYTLPEFLKLSDGSGLSGNTELSPEIIDYLTQNNWDVSRFFEVLGRVGAGLAASEMENTDNIIDQQTSEIMSNPMFSDREKNILLSDALSKNKEMKAVKSSIQITPYEMDLIERNKRALQRILGVE